MQCWDWEFACDFVELSWAVKFGVMNAVLGLKESMCDLDEQSLALKIELWMQCYWIVCVWLIYIELGYEGRIVKAVLGLKESVCDFAEQSRAVKANLWMQWLKEFACDFAEQNRALEIEL